MSKVKARASSRKQGASFGITPAWQDLIRRELDRQGLTIADLARMIGAKTASAISNALAEGALSTRFKRDIHQALGLTFTDLDLPEPIRNSNETAELLRMWRDLPTEA